MTTEIVFMNTGHQKLMKVFTWSSFWKKFNSPGQMTSLQVFLSKRSWVETPSQFCWHFRDLVRTPEPQVRLQLDHSLHNVISVKNVIKIKIRVNKKVLFERKKIFFHVSGENDITFRTWSLNNQFSSELSGCLSLQLSIYY